MKSENSQTEESKSVKDLMRDIFRENKRREFHWETLTDEILTRIWTGEWPRRMKETMQKTVEGLFPIVRQEMETSKEGVFCPTFEGDGRWRILAQTLKDLEEDAEDVIQELLRRQRRAEAFNHAKIRGAEAAVAQGILDQTQLSEELESADMADKRILPEKSEEEDENKEDSI